MTQQASAPAPAGALLGQRYQLGHALPQVGRAPSVVWRAEDTVLARPVAVRVLTEVTGDPAPERAAARERFVTAAVQGGKATHPSVAAVLDADVQRGAGSKPATAYAVVRWVDGVPLTQLLSGEPLEPIRALQLVIAACRGVGALHEAGIPHGRLHPGNLLVGVDDSVTVTDAVLASVLHGDPDPLTTDAVEGDTRALGWVLHCALTGYWAGPRTWSPRFPPAPTDDAGRIAGPRAVRGGISRDLDALVLRVLEPSRKPGDSPIRTPAMLASALTAALTPLLERADRTGRSAADRREDGERVRWWRTRRGRWGLRFGILVLLAAGGWVTGYTVGKVPNPPGSSTKALPALPSPSPAAAGTGTPIAVSASMVSAFDPEGDGAEDDAKVGNAVDGDPSTAWTTEQYTSDATFGGKKSGVGLLVDLGTAQKVSDVTLSLGGTGTNVELRAAPSLTTAPTSAGQLQVVASATAASGDDVELKPTAAVTSRFFLVWITSLPPVSGGFAASINEMTFTQ